ncbi:MAG: tRNA (adenosine(37)-N6)-threonylcarbamoyltransferase complex ATPase subunit type 1 TsaE [Gammaproteobacteria bacterium]|nr:tRNA (adenosine(37)-N6)-threonylcarbamoyltransferase complex ATPase subunit type 1 TsaE [Gammaproteobacteria bacterium]
MPHLECALTTAADMEAWGGKLAAQLQDTRLIYLHGPLGAGKTTLVRGMLRALGHSGAVKSPTFTLVEPYEFVSRPFYHFDLYRLNDPEELEFVGIRDYLRANGVCVVEWAERAQGLLPTPDLDIIIALTETGRMMRITSLSARGKASLDTLTC